MNLVFAGIQPLKNSMKQFLFDDYKKKKKPTIFDLTFDIHDNPGDLRFISEFGIFLLLISLCEQVLKTHQKHNIFSCVFVVFCIRNPPDFLDEGAI